jgi:hypothetical protein
MTGIIDDAAIFGTALGEADIKKLASGTLPNALAASTKLLAYWDFNDAKSAVQPTLSVARSATGLTLTFSGTPQSASTVTRPWTDVTGNSSPATITFSGAQQYFRTKQ